MMRLFHSLALMVVAMGLSAQQPAAAPVRFGISGTVVDSVTGAPLDHTVVAIAPVTKRDDFQTMTTNADGRFVFADLAKNKYTLSAQRRGYLAQSFEQHDQYSTSIAVGPDLESTGLVFRLRPEASVHGKITDDHGDPVANAQVFLFRTGSTPTGSGTNLQRRMNTDDEGSFRFAHLPPGKFYMVVSAQPWYTEGIVRNLAIVRRDSQDGAQQQPQQTVSLNTENRSPLDLTFPITFYPGASDLAGASPIVLEPGSRFIADMTLQAVPAIHLVIKSSSPAEPGKGRYGVVTQLVAGDFTVNIPASVSFVDQSTLFVSGLAPGAYKLDVVTQGAAGDPAHSVRTMDVSTDAELGAEDDTSSATVGGIVKFDNNSSLPARGYIFLRNRKTRETLSTQISPKGEFEWKGSVQPGTYDVMVNNVPDSLVKGIAASGASSSGHTITIKGSAPVKLAVMLTQGVGRLEGTAQRDGKPFAGAMIVLVPEDPASNMPLFRRDQSDSDGTFTLASVLPGKYTVVAIENGWDLEWANPTVLKPYLAAGEIVNVSANGRYQVKVKVQRLGLPELP